MNNRAGKFLVEKKYTQIKLCVFFDLTSYQSVTIIKVTDW